MPLTAGQEKIYTIQSYLTLTDSGQVIDSTSVLGALLSNYLHVTLFEDEIKDCWLSHQQHHIQVMKINNTFNDIFCFIMLTAYETLRLPLFKRISLIFGLVYVHCDGNKQCFPSNTV